MSNFTLPSGAHHPKPICAQQGSLLASNLNLGRTSKCRVGQSTARRWVVQQFIASICFLCHICAVERGHQWLERARQFSRSSPQKRCIVIMRLVERGLAAGFWNFPGKILMWRLPMLRSWRSFRGTASDAVRVTKLSAYERLMPFLKRSKHFFIFLKR